MRAPVHATLAALAVVVGCDTESATTAVVDDDYPVTADGGDASGDVTVYKAWWVTTLFASPVAPGAESESQRTVPASDYAYALLAPGWNPSSPSPPARLVAVRSKDKLGVSRGDTLHVRVSPAAFTGDCASGAPLTHDEADFITTRIFPGDFAGTTYDAATCTTTPIADAGPLDAGALDSSDAAPLSDADADADADADIVADAAQLRD